MLKNIKNTDILFLDIETVPLYKSLSEMSPKLQELWDKKSAFFRDSEQSSEDVWQRAGIYAEFGKIICISAGFITKDRSFRMKSFYDDDERNLLLNFKKMLDTSFRGNEKFLCAHNGKEFDYPYIARRMLINGIDIPQILDLAGKKPWEVKHLDTLELWKFGDYKNYTSLELLTEIFQIPTPKDDIDGSMVANVYYEENDLNRIKDYCEKDVLAVAQLYLRYKNEALINTDKIINV